MPCPHRFYPITGVSANDTPYITTLPGPWDPGSKLAATRWVDKDAHVPGLPVPDQDAAYRAMDLLLEVEEILAEQV